MVIAPNIIVLDRPRADLDGLKIFWRLKQWCADAMAAEEKGTLYSFVFVDEKSFGKHNLQSSAGLVASFVEYQP